VYSTSQTIEAVKEVAAQTGLPDESAVAKVAEDALQAAEALGAEAAAKVKEALHVEALPTESKEPGAS
jgi:hypothetical protein